MICRGRSRRVPSPLPLAVRRGARVRNSLLAWKGGGELNKQAVCDSSTTKLYNMQISVMQMWVVRVSFSRVIYKSVGICTFAETTIPVA